CHLAQCRGADPRRADTRYGFLGAQPRPERIPVMITQTLPRTISATRTSHVTHALLRCGTTSTTTSTAMPRRGHPMASPARVWFGSSERRTLPSHAADSTIAVRHCWAVPHLASGGLRGYR